MPRRRRAVRRLSFARRPAARRTQSVAMARIAVTITGVASNFTLRRTTSESQRRQQRDQDHDRQAVARRVRRIHRAELEDSLHDREDDQRPYVERNLSRRRRRRIAAMPSGRRRRAGASRTSSPTDGRGIARRVARHRTAAARDRGIVRGDVAPPASSRTDASLRIRRPHRPAAGTTSPKASPNAIDAGRALAASSASAAAR